MTRAAQGGAGGTEVAPGCIEKRNNCNYVTFLLDKPIKSWKRKKGLIPEPAPNQARTFFWRCHTGPEQI